MADARELTSSLKKGVLPTWIPQMSLLRSANPNRRKKILDRARVLFWKKGYPGTSMVDLANACDCKPGNLYNYFNTKEEILFAVLLEEMEQIIRPIEHLEEDETSDPANQLRVIIATHLKVTLSRRRSAKTLFDVALDSLSPANRKIIVSMRDDYDRIIRKVIRRGQERGVFLPLDEKLAGFMIASMITRTRIWFHPSKGVTIDELADFTFRFVLNGIQNAVAMEKALLSPGATEVSGKRAVK